MRKVELPLDPFAETDEEIIQRIGMAELPLILHCLFQKYRGKYQLIDIGGDCMFRFGETNVANVSYLAVYLHFLSIHENLLRMEGNVSWPADLQRHFSLKICINGIMRECELQDAGLDLTMGRVTYETRKAFVLEQELNPETAYEIIFYYVCEGVLCQSHKINFMRFSPVADVLKGQYACLEGWILQEEKARLKITKAEKHEREDYERIFRRNLEAELEPSAAGFIEDIRDGYFDGEIRHKRRIWLFMDRIDKAGDNGEAFFAYVCGHRPEHTDCYFVISRDSGDYERLSRIGPVVDALSREHRTLLLQAEYLFTSQLNGWVENPYGGYEEYFRDLYHAVKVVFLQHGVTKDDQTSWLNRYQQNLYAIVTSSQREADAFAMYPYFYEKDQIWNTGMPRLDRLRARAGEYVLFMPTWRRECMEQRLIPEKGIYQWCLKEGFVESQYYQVYHEILSDKRFVRKYTDSSCHIVFMPHPIMQPYVREFRVDEEVVVPPCGTSLRDLFEKCHALVTDYSSAAFDLAYLGKPIIYFQFDEDDFFRTHTYRKGYFDYKKMGFGEVVHSKKQLERALDACMKNGWKRKEKYSKRAGSFFTYSDGECCRRVLDKVLEG